MTQSPRSKSYIELMIAGLHRRKRGDFHGKRKKEIGQKDFNAFFGNYSNITCHIYFI